MTWNAPKSLSKAFSITVVAATRDLGTASYRIPSRVGPLDCRFITHF